MPASYGLRPPEAGLLSWAGAAEKLAKARNYWVATTRPDGRPHAVPVWGVWLDGVFSFATERASRKARNLAANPAVAVHLESGDDAVMLEGRAWEVTQPSRRAAFDDAYFAKYAVRLADVPGEVSVWAVRPRVALAWQEKDFPGTATRWTLEARA
jgi:pyridoxine/pyridoxamine 5'-phosphate oxidase